MNAPPHDRPPAEPLAATLLEIAATAVEHADALDVMALVNYIDLYRWHIETRREAPYGLAALPFASFVADSRALAAAAHGVARESGIATVSPPPLVVRADDS